MHRWGEGMSSLSKSRRRNRSGVAATEAAILLPVFVVTVFASIEGANALYLKQSLTLAAYEAATIIEDDSGTEAVAEARCGQILSARDVETFEMAITPAPSALSPGDVFVVNVSSPASAYAIGPTFFFQSSTISASVSNVRH